MALYLSAWSMKYVWDIRCRAWLSPLTGAWCYLLLLVLTALCFGLLFCCQKENWFCVLVFFVLFLYTHFSEMKRDFLRCCSAEWEESVPVEKFFVQSVAGVLDLSRIRSHLSPLSVLLCSQSICSWIRSCLALRAQYLGHGTRVGSAKGNLVVRGERPKEATATPV